MLTNTSKTDIIAVGSPLDYVKKCKLEQSNKTEKPSVFAHNLTDLKEKMILSIDDLAELSMSSVSYSSPLKKEISVPLAEIEGETKNVIRDRSISYESTLISMPIESSVSDPKVSIKFSTKDKDDFLNNKRLSAIGLPKLNLQSLLEVPKNMTPKRAFVESDIFMGILNTGDRNKLKNNNLKKRYLDFISIMNTREKDRLNKVGIIKVFPDYHHYLFSFMKYNQEINNELGVGDIVDTYIHTEHSDYDFIFKRQIKYNIGKFSIIVANKAIIKEWKNILRDKLKIPKDKKYPPKVHDEEFAFKMLKSEYDVPKNHEQFRKYNLYLISKKIAYDGLIASLIKNKIMPLRTIYDKPEFLTKFVDHDCLRSKTYWIISQIFLDKESVRYIEDEKSKKIMAYKILNSWAVPKGFLRRVVNFVNMKLEDSEFKKIYITNIE